MGTRSADVMDGRKSELEVMTSNPNATEILRFSVMTDDLTRAVKNIQLEVSGGPKADEDGRLWVWV